MSITYILGNRSAESRWSVKEVTDLGKGNIWRAKGT